MTTPAAFLLVALGGLLGLLPPQAGSSDDEKRSNVAAPLKQFGLWGTDPGRLLGPLAVAVSGQDRLLVADTGNHRIQVFLGTGARVGGWGARGGGPGEFLFPSGVAVGSDGEVFVSDTGNGRIQVFDVDGRHLREWREAEPGTPLRAPAAIAVSADAVAVAEPDASTIRVFSKDGRLRRTIGGALGPAGLAWDESGALYVADSVQHQIQVYDPSGMLQKSWGIWGHQEGMFARPSGIGLATGRVYVVDSANHRVQVFDREGGYLYQWGRAPIRAFEGEGRLHAPAALAVSPSGGLTVVLEPLEHRIQVFGNGTAKKVTPVKDLPWWEDQHSKRHAPLPPTRPVDPSGAVHLPVLAPVLTGILDADNEGVLIFNLAYRPGVLVARIGGSGRKLGELRDPSAVVVDSPRRRIYVAERGNRRVQVFDLALQPGSLTGFAPSARVVEAFEPAKLVPASVTGYRADVALPEALALDPSGNLLVVDGPNCAVLVFDSKLQFVRAVRLAEPGERAPSRWTGVASTHSGSRLFVVDTWRSRVLAFDRDGGPVGAWGTPELFPAPVGVAVDTEDRVFVSDRLTSAVRVFDLKGQEVARYGGFASEPRKFSSPLGITAYLKDGEVPERMVVDDAGFHRGNLLTTDGKSYELLIKGGSLPPPRSR